MFSLLYYYPIVIFQSAHDIGGSIYQAKQFVFPGRGAAHFDVGDQDMDVPPRQLPQCVEDAPEAPPALMGFHLFVVIRIEQAENDDGAAGCRGKEAWQLCGNRRLCLECGERARHVCPLQERLGGEAEVCGDS